MQQITDNADKSVDEIDDAIDETGNKTHEGFLLGRWVSCPPDVPENY